MGWESLLTMKTDGLVEGLCEPSAVCVCWNILINDFSSGVSLVKTFRFYIRNNTWSLDSVVNVIFFSGVCRLPVLLTLQVSRREVVVVFELWNVTRNVAPKFVSTSRSGCRKSSVVNCQNLRNFRAQWIRTGCSMGHVLVRSGRNPSRHEMVGRRQ